MIIVIRNEQFKPADFRLPEPKNFEGDGQIVIDFDEMSAEIDFMPTSPEQIVRNTSMFITYFGVDPTIETLSSGEIVLFNWFRMD